MRVTVALFLLSLVLIVAPAAGVVRTVDQGMANPIRRVVTMLQNMQKKVAAEAKAEEELYDKFMCYCKNGEADLEATIAVGKGKIPEVKSKIEEETAKLEQTKADLKAAIASRSEAKETMAKATALREEQASAYSKESTDYKTNIKALADASAAISKGMSGAFLQARTVSIIRRVAIDGPSMNDEDRQMLLSFLSGQHGAQYVPKSGEIVGILDQLKDEMTKSLEEITADETSAVSSYEGLMAAKKKELAALQVSIESKQKAVGDIGVEIEMMKGDLGETEKALLEDTKFLEDLSASCETKKSEWAEIVKMRAEEQVALSETIKILNDDDALELFKKTLPSASLLQTDGSVKAVKAKAAAILAKARKSSNPDGLALNFVELALKGKGGFEKVIKMIDDMVELLKKEQVDDDTEKAFCEEQFDTVEDEIKMAKQKIADLETKIDAASGSIEEVKAEIKNLEKGVKALDKSVAEATEQRKEEHATYVELMQSDAEAKEVISWAKNRMNKFYNPTIYKAPPKVELAAGLIQVSNAPMLTQVFAHHQQMRDAPPPPPASFKAYSKQSGESAGVIKMMDTLIADLDKEMQTAEVDEKDAQKAYEKTMQEAGDKRAQDVKLITEKKATKAELETELDTSTADSKATTKELSVKVEYEAGLHSKCDWLMKYFDVRKEARAGEVESLKSAKAVLSGADYSFLQSPLAGSRKVLRR